MMLSSLRVKLFLLKFAAVAVAVLAVAVEFPPGS